MPDQLLLTRGGEDDLDDIYARMLRDFPSEELKSKDQLRRLLCAGCYELYLGRHEPERGASMRDDADGGCPSGPVVGYAFVYVPNEYAPNEPRVVWLDYFAIAPGQRGAGLGTAFVAALRERLRGSGDGILLEVEPEASADPAERDLQRRRIAFYRRLGARRLDIAYRFPTATGSYPLLLFYLPIAPVSVLSRERIQRMVRAVYAEVHADVPDHERILESFIGTARDTPLSPV